MISLQIYDAVLIQSAEAATRDIVETSFGFALFDTARNHPLGTFLFIVLLLGVIAAIGIYVVRQVKREARGYMTSGRERWSRLSRRFNSDSRNSASRSGDVISGETPLSRDSVHDHDHSNVTRLHDRDKQPDIHKKSRKII